MYKITRAPANYIQGPDAFEALAAAAKAFGTHGYVLWAPFAMAQYQTRLEALFQEQGIMDTSIGFEGLCTERMARETAGQIKNAGADVIIGIGGGTVLDAAKAAAFYAKLPLILVPTAASMDGPCSSLAVLYQEKGGIDRYLPLKKGPDLVLADSQILLHAPIRMTTAGMGDALSTYYEARACRASGGLTDAGGRSSYAAFVMAKACRESLFAHGIQALEDIRAGRLSQAVENIIETNLYLSGIGFESGGLAGAHGFCNAFGALPGCRAMHGELAALGTIAQLTLEEDWEELKLVREFCLRTGLPVRLRDAAELEEADIPALARMVCQKGSSIYHMHFAVTEDMVERVLREIF